MRGVEMLLRVVSGLALCLAVGCGDGVPEEWSPRMANPEIPKVKVGKEMSIPEMAADDAVVVVNGAILTKREVDARLQRYRFMLSRARGMQAKERDARYKKYGQDLVGSFINEQLFAWAGRTCGVLQEADVRAAVASNLTYNAKALRCKPEELGKVIPGGLVSFCRAIEDMAWVKAYIAREVKIETVIDDEVVSNVLSQINAENAAILASNRLVRAKIEGIRADIVAGKIDFETAAARFSDDLSADDNKAYWGEFRLSDISDPKLKAALDELSDGGLSEVLEDDEGYMIVRQVERKGGSVKLERILLEREAEIVLQDRANLKRDMQNVKTQECISKRGQELYEKAVIVFPHGTNFWTSAKR